MHLSVFFRGEKIHTSVQRMFRIWKERKVYDNGFLRELEQLIGTWEETMRIQQRICCLSAVLFFFFFFCHSEPPSQKSPAKSTEVKQHPDFKVCKSQTDSHPPERWRVREGLA